MSSPTRQQGNPEDTSPGKVTEHRGAEQSAKEPSEGWGARISAKKAGSGKRSTSPEPKNWTWSSPLSKATSSLVGAPEAIARRKRALLRQLLQGGRTVIEGCRQLRDLRQGPRNRSRRGSWPQVRTSLRNPVEQVLIKIDTKPMPDRMGESRLI